MHPAYLATTRGAGQVLDTEAGAPWQEARDPQGAREKRVQPAASSLGFEAECPHRSVEEEPAASRLAPEPPLLAGPLSVGMPLAELQLGLYMVSDSGRC